MCKFNIKLAVQIHIFYEDLLNELQSYLNNIAFKYDLFITTVSFEKKHKIESFFSTNGNYENIKISVYENRGRDVLPFLMQMKDYINNYDYILHLHTKKSGTVSFGDSWRRYLYKNLLGSKTYFSSIIDLFEKNKRLGLVFPFNYPVVSNACDWGDEKNICIDILKELRLSTGLPDIPDFPAGNMFIARCEAVKQLFNNSIISLDFPNEKGQVNFTPAHAIERIWVYLAKANNYISMHKNLFNSTKSTYKNNILLLYAHYNPNEIISKEDLDSLQLLNKFAKEIIFISNSKINNKSQNKINKYCKKIFIRENKGYDFGAWKEAILNIDKNYINNFDKLMLINNSCVGPYLNMESLYNIETEKEVDFFGVSAFPYLADGSCLGLKEIHEHIQSYCMIFNKTVFLSKSFHNYWTNLIVYDDFNKTVANGEIALTNYLRKNGYKYNTLVNESLYFNEWLGTNEPHNLHPSAYLLLESPFLKKKANLLIDDKERNYLNEIISQIDNLPKSFNRYFKHSLLITIPNKLRNKTKMFIIKSKRFVHNKLSS